MKSAFVVFTLCLVILLVGLFHLACPTSAQQPTSSPQAFLPNATLTPGDTLAVTAKDVCTLGYAGKVRNVPDAIKAQVYKNYGIGAHKPGEYEVDHLISLELGGSNSIKNLWPQSYLSQPWNAHVKDKLENMLHQEVCAGKITLAAAQQEIRSDWTAAYRKRFGNPSASGK